jgi:hypothetical protein
MHADPAARPRALRGTKTEEARYCKFNLRKSASAAIFTLVDP